MAQYYTDFNNDTLGSIPNDWSDVWGSYGGDARVDESSILPSGWESLVGPKYLRYQDVGNFNRAALKYDGLAESVVSEIRGILRSSRPTNTSSIVTLVLCGGGLTSGTRTGYVLVIRPGNGNYEIRRKLNGSFVTVASGTLPSSYANQDTAGSFHGRLEVVESGGSNVIVRSKVWSTLNTEPTVWDLAYEDTSPLSAGWQAFGSFGSSSFYGAGRVGIGTNGDPAPTVPVPVGPTTPTGLITSNITANSFRAGWTP